MSTEAKKTQPLLEPEVGQVEHCVQQPAPSAGHTGLFKSIMEIRPRMMKPLCLLEANLSELHHDVLQNLDLFAPARACESKLRVWIKK